MQLFRVEVRRLVHRRAFRLLVAVFVLGLLFVLGKQFVDSNRDVEAARARARQQASTQTQDFREQATRCEAEKAAGRLPSDYVCGPASGAGDEFEVPESAFFDDPRFNFRAETPGHSKGAGLTFALFAFLIGATFAGADWSSGTVQALLFWEPRRLRVLLTKVAALLTVCAVVAVGIIALLVGLEYVTASSRGIVGATSIDFYASLGLTALRTIGVVAFAAALGFSVAGLTRNTGAALGVGFLYFAVTENAIRGLRPGWRRFLVGENVQAWVEKGMRIILPPRRGQAVFSEDSLPSFFLSMERGGVTLAIYALALIAVMTVLFLRRDVS